MIPKCHPWTASINDIEAKHEAVLPHDTMTVGVPQTCVSRTQGTTLCDETLPSHLRMGCHCAEAIDGAARLRRHEVKHDESTTLQDTDGKLM
jgi:hypothetical protein